MDGGLSWADQWDNNPDPPPSGSSENGKKKGKEGKSRLVILHRAWGFIPISAPQISVLLQQSSNIHDRTAGKND
ncbi:hypothetical protein M0R45_021598 [Rubus argutus]|uniref:Uncharacterized protein n=1 Tax=Rubus argutus TaxID=59490 RepID=A0AAW1XEU1_RUBAR